MKPLVVFILPFLNPKKVAYPISCSILWIWILWSCYTLDHHEVINFLLLSLQQILYSLVRYLWISTNAIFAISIQQKNINFMVIHGIQIRILPFWNAKQKSITIETPHSGSIVMSYQQPGQKKCIYGLQQF